MLSPLLKDMVGGGLTVTKVVFESIDDDREEYEYFRLTVTKVVFE